MPEARDRLSVETKINIVVLGCTILGLILAHKQYELGKNQLRLAEEQMREKRKDILISGGRWSNDRKFSSIHFHLQNIGEVDIGRQEFELGPYLEFENPVVLECRNIYSDPPELRAECKKDNTKYISIKSLTSLRPRDLVSFDVKCSGDPGTIKYVYRIRGGASGSNPVAIDVVQPPDYGDPR